MGQASLDDWNENGHLAPLPSHKNLRTTTWVVNVKSWKEKQMGKRDKRTLGRNEGKGIFGRLLPTVVVFVTSLVFRFVDC